MIKEIIELRHRLHQAPELSNKEFNTSDIITQFMRVLKPDEENSLGLTGKAFVFKGHTAGKTLMYRAELDALPIHENSGLSYASIKMGISHACGHDGHMAILLGLAKYIASNRPQKGQVVFLFQPAEEEQQGAKDMIETSFFKSNKPDFIFALHNIPGYSKGQILLKDETFAAASKGVTITLTGKNAHAAEPENGINPALAISKIIDKLYLLKEDFQLFKSMVLITVIHIKLGEIAFGTSPGKAQIMLTLRSYENNDMHILTHEMASIIDTIAKQEYLSYNISYSEVFPAVVNSKEATVMVQKASETAQINYTYLSTPFKWSEDFSYYLSQTKGCLFGIGTGEKHPQLHNNDYDFPDDIIETGIRIFYNIYQQFKF